tara:strand:- start:186 stop:365 length:180 start_codon:yes stop_codon:yes gene_type:complete
MTSEEYLKKQFDRLKNTKYGFSVKIWDGEGNHTNQMELTPNRASQILKILQERLKNETL